MSLYQRLCRAWPDAASGRGRSHPAAVLFALWKFLTIFSKFLLVPAGADNEEEGLAVNAILKLFETKDPVRVAQQLIAADTSDNDRLADVVAHICKNRLWRDRLGPKGSVFETLAQFVIAPPPYGLGVQTDVALRKLRAALLNKMLFREWIEVREGVIRPRGHPKTKIAHSEDLLPVFKSSTSSTAIDQVLPRLLRNHEKIFQLVEAGKLSIHRAGLETGIIRRNPTNRRDLRFGTVDFNALQTLSPAVRTRLLRMVFDAVGLNAQCGLLASRLDGVIGDNTADAWRKKKTEPTSGSS